MRDGAAPWSNVTLPMVGWQRVANAQTSSRVLLGSMSSGETMTFGRLVPALVANKISPILRQKASPLSAPLRVRHSGGTVTTSQCNADSSGIQAVVTGT